MIRTRQYGWLPDLPDHRDRVYSAPKLMAKRIPASVNLAKAMPPVYSQGSLGSCTSMAIAAALHYNHRKQGDLKCPTPSRLFIYFNERVMEGTVNEDSGAFLRDGIKSAAKQGVCHETLWPYDVARFRDVPPRICYDQALEHQVTSYSRVPVTERSLKGCLADGFPVVFGFSVYESFESRTVTQTGIVPMPALSEAMVGGHAVLLVGYQDAGRKWIVRNSWGQSWGKQGYCLFPYEYLLDPDLAADFWTIRSVEIAGCK